MRIQFQYQLHWQKHWNDVNNIIWQIVIIHIVCTVLHGKAKEFNITI